MLWRWLSALFDQESQYALEYFGGRYANTRRDYRYACRITSTDKCVNSIGGTTDREALIAWINQHNQDHVDAHREDDLAIIFADLAATRENTLALLVQCTDEQIAIPVAGAPWSDGTIGGVIITNAHHAVQHMAWIEEGLHQHS